MTTARFSFRPLLRSRCLWPCAAASPHPADFGSDVAFSTFGSQRVGGMSAPNFCFAHAAGASDQEREQERGYQPNQWPCHPDDEQRIAALHDFHLLDTDFEEPFDRLATLAARHFDVPIALVSLVDTDRQWFKAAEGLPVRQTCRDAAFCTHAIMPGAPTIFEINDAAEDKRRVAPRLHPAASSPHASAGSAQVLRQPAGHWRPVDPLLRGPGPRLRRPAHRDPLSHRPQAAAAPRRLAAKRAHHVCRHGGRPGVPAAAGEAVRLLPSSPLYPSLSPLPCSPGRGLRDANRPQALCFASGTLCRRRLKPSSSAAAAGRYEIVQSQLYKKTDELQAKNRELSDLVDTANAPIFAVDRHLVVTAWNQKAGRGLVASHGARGGSLHGPDCEQVSQLTSIPAPPPPSAARTPTSEVAPPEPRRTALSLGRLHQGRLHPLPR